MSTFPIRVWLTDNTTMYRMVDSLDHETLCKAFNLDPCSTAFDVPTTFFGTGSASIGYGGNYGSNRIIEGYIMQHNQPIGRIYKARIGDSFRDLDPTNTYSMLNDQQLNSWR